jgi:HK97 family phage major capsid protein
MPDEPTIQGTMEAVTALREHMDGKRWMGEDQLEKVETYLEAQEDLNIKRQKERDVANAKTKEIEDELSCAKEDMEKAGTKASEQSTRLEVLEATMARGFGSNSNDPKAFQNTPEYKALNRYCKEGLSLFTPEEKQLLRTDSAVSGGILVDGEMETFITKQIVELDDFRPLARVRTISSKSIDLPIRTTIPTATYEGEAEAGGDSVPAYVNETLTPFRQHVAIPITQDQLQDSSFDMNAELTSEAALAFGVGEGSGFVVGTGFKEPQGFTVNANVVTTDTIAQIAVGARLVVTGDDIILLSGTVKVGYNMTIVFHRTTLSFLRVLRADSGEAATPGTGAYLWEPALSGPAANTFGGMPYRMLPSMPLTDTAGNVAVVLGDFRRAYTIVDRTGISVVRDDVTQADQAIVKFTWNRWNTGQVTLAEAIKGLTIQA